MSEEHKLQFTGDEETDINMILNDDSSDDEFYANLFEVTDSEEGDG